MCQEFPESKTREGRPASLIPFVQRVSYQEEQLLYLEEQRIG